MFSRVRTSLVDFFIMAGRERARNSLLGLNDRLLEDAGFSRELLKQGVSAWPWRLDDEENTSTRQSKKTINVYNMVNEQEQDIQQAIDELRSYSDRELAELNIARSDIEFVVRNGRPKLDQDPRNLNLNKHQQIAA